MNYYNEHDRKMAAWLRELIRGGHISPGVVDERVGAIGGFGNAIVPQVAAEFIRAYYEALKTLLGVKI